MMCVAALLSSLVGCSAWYEIHGPSAELGFQYRAGEGFAPRVGAGYSFDRYKLTYGYGAGVQASYLPLEGKLQLSSELHGFTAPLMLIPVFVGPTIEIQPGARPVWGLVAGVLILNAYPPQGDSHSDTYFPDWMTRNRFRLDFPLQRSHWPDGKFNPAVSLSLEALASLHWLRTGETQTPEGD